MAEPDPKDQRRTRIFIIVFFGAALLMSVTTILGTWARIDEAAQAATTAAPAGAPAAPTSPGAPGPSRPAPP